MKKLIALNDTVICEVNLNKESKTETGIYLPSQMDKESQSQAKVVSVGPDVNGISVGDNVIISRVEGEIFYLDGNSYYALRKNNIFCVIKESDING